MRQAHLFRELIVTGFNTEPAEVRAGNFKLIVHLKNASSKTAVSNMLFDMQAPVIRFRRCGGSSGVSSGIGFKALFILTEFLPEERATFQSN